MRNSDTSPALSARIILFGSEGGFSRAVLERLLSCSLNVVAVVIAEALQSGLPFPVDVKQAAKRGSFEESAIKNNVAIIKTHALNNKAFIRRLCAKQADIMLLACFARKIPARIWRTTPCWNLHPSLLPAYRGPNPLYWQIKNSETKTGLTLHEVTDEIDSGDIVMRKQIPLPAKHDNSTLDIWVSENGVKLFYQALIKHLQGEIELEPQEKTMANCSSSETESA